MASGPEVGGEAPDFTLPGLRLNGTEAEHASYTLSAERGHPIVLAFYPGDETPACTRQMCSYSSGLEEFVDLGATVWGISPQGIESHEHFARKHDLRLPLLADVDRTVVKAYGIGLGNSLRRAIFIVDGEGIVRYRHVALVGVTYRSLDTLKRELSALKVG
jgi:thioredoxin-dependent peroxiredoxin